MNPIYENSTDTSLGSCWGCAVTIAKELPCIYDAIKSVSVQALLDCGVDKSDVSHPTPRVIVKREELALTCIMMCTQLCNCADCLPDAVQPYVNQFCQSKAMKPKKPTLKNPIAPAERIAGQDLNFQGFKGSLPKSTLDDIKALSACPGTSCGGCGCCVGVCAWGECLGGCGG
jgi:hypothetical protein